MALIRVRATAVFPKAAAAPAPSPIGMVERKALGLPPSKSATMTAAQLFLFPCKTSCWSSPRCCWC
ncbi:MAG: hypothetical protein WA924_00725, partial [Burkholderiaceae bacterium]